VCGDSVVRFLSVELFCAIVRCLRWFGGADVLEFFRQNTQMYGDGSVLLHTHKPPTPHPTNINTQMCALAAGSCRAFPPWCWCARLCVRIAGVGFVFCGVPCGCCAVLWPVGGCVMCSLGGAVWFGAWTLCGRFVWVGGLWMRTWVSCGVFPCRLWLGVVGWVLSGYVGLPRVCFGVLLRAVCFPVGCGAFSG